MIDAAPADTFALEPQAPYTVVTPAGHPAVDRWQPPAHLRRVRPALVLLAGETLELPPLRVGAESRLRLEFAAALPQISCDGLEIEVVGTRDGASQCLFRALLRGDETLNPPRRVELSLPAGAPLRLAIRCLPGPAGDPRADWLALIEATVGRADELDLIAARAFRQLRIDNERHHFAHAYEHPMYVARRARVHRGIDSLIPSERSFSVPGAIENAFDYALARLCTRLQHKAPDFEARLRAKVRAAPPLRILSVGTGLGLTEAALLHRVDAAVDLTIVDVNDDLLRAAAALLPAHVRVRPVVADVNDLALPDGGFDLAVCVSGVHHLVELGALFRRVRDALAPQGELWLIGEQIGPSGNRLDEDAFAAADRIFSALPAEFRHNSATGQVDAHLEIRDCAEATFEGILSHRIEDELARFFRPVAVSRRNCFLWRLVGPEYVGNYRIDDTRHRSLLDTLVEHEVSYYLAGGRPTELHGVYVPLR
jgi:SAM-dependent methyltransferase